MLRLTTKLSIKSRIVLKCDKHPRYNPEKDGRDGIRGACSRCLYLLSIYTARQLMVNAARDYEQVSKPYETIKPRAPRVSIGPKPESELGKAMARNAKQYHLLREEGPRVKTVKKEVTSGYQDGDYGMLADFILHPHPEKK